MRVTLQALAAVLGGTQSLHTNSFDEALALPSDESVTIALRTQQILAHESGVAATADPLAGSFAVESLTDEVEVRTVALMHQIEEMGGAVRAIELGFMQRAIEDAAYEYQRSIERGTRPIVGLNRFATGGRPRITLLRVDPAVQGRQLERLAALRRERDGAAVGRALAELRAAARSTDNLLYPMRDALKAYATLGEIVGVLKEELGEYRAREAMIA